MQSLNLNTKLNKVRNKIIDNTLIFGTILGFVTYLISLFSIASAGFKLSFITDFIVIAIFAIIAFFRKMISINVKSFIIVGGILVLVVFDVFKWGIHADNLSLLITVPLFSFLAFSMRKTIYLYLFSLLIVSIVGFLILSNITVLRPDFASRVYKPDVWIVNLLIITIVAYIIVIIINQFNKTFERLVIQLDGKNKELSIREQNYRELFNSSTDAIFIQAFDGKILDVNDAMLQMYGYTKNEVKQLSIADLSSGKKGYNLSDAEFYLKEVSQKGAVEFDWQAKKRNGDVFWVEVILKSTQLVNEDVILAVVRDNDEKKKAAIQLAQYKNELETLVLERTKELQDTNEDLKATNEELFNQSSMLQSTLNKLQSTQERLVQSEKMASLGTLSSGVAHEINNPLNFIQGGLLGLQNYFNQMPNEKNKNTEYFLKAIDEGVKRAANIVHSLNRLSRPDDTPKEPCNVHKIIDNCLTVLANKINGAAVIEKNYCVENDQIMANDSKLHQALINIITNALQAIGANGVIKIFTEIKNKNIYIYVNDNGKGIAKENLAKITEPFFTTKAPGEGTGLGLSMAYNIIKEHNGTIDFNSEQNIGTTVIIELPTI